MRNVDVAARKARKATSAAEKARGPRNMAEALVMIKAAAEEMNATPGLFASFIHRRGSGAELLRRYDGTEQLATARASLSGEAPFDLRELAGRPRLVNIHADDDEPLTTKAQRATYFRYFMANARAGTAAGLLAPPAASPPGADGVEDFCRACQHGHVPLKKWRSATKAARGELMACDHPGCTAAYHPFCLGLPGAPAGRWVCPGCTFAPGVAAHPVARPGDPEPENLLAGLEDDEYSGPAGRGSAQPARGSAGGRAKLLLH